MTNNENHSGRMLLKNTLWSVLGLVLPVLVGFFTIPILISEIGNERFGVLALVWMVVGYFSIFDFGLGRALTKLIAERLAKNDRCDIASLVWVALFISLVLAFVFSLALYVFSGVIVFEWLNISEEVRTEALSACKIVSLAIPVVVLTTICRAVLEAYHKFKVINIIRLPLGLVTFLGPILALQFSDDMAVIVWVLVVGRLVGLGAYAYYMIQSVPEIGQGVNLKLGQVNGLLSYGGWMTVANIAAPLIMYVDRFVIGGAGSVGELAYYVAPYEVLAKVALLPMALITVLFPTFSGLFHVDRVKASTLYGRSNTIILLLVFPLVLFCVCFSSEAIGYWLGDDFSVNSARVFQWLAIGVLINNLAKVSFVVIQSAGRPDLLAKLYILQLPVYLYLMWFFIGEFGLVGVAIVWVLRAALDTVVLSFITARLMPEAVGQCWLVLLKCGLAVLLLLGVMQIDGLANKVVVFFGAILVYLWLEWRYGVADEDKILVSLGVSKLVRES